MPLNADIIDDLAGLTPDHRLSELRLNRAQAKTYAQASHAALFEPLQDETFSRQERFAVAFFVAELQDDEAASRLYATRLGAVSPIRELTGAVRDAAAARRTTGPQNGGHPASAIAQEAREVIGNRLLAAFAHAELLVLRPRDASPAALTALSGAGWSTDAIVTLSQLVAFLTFQVRVAAGLRVLAQAGPAAALPPTLAQKELA